MTHHSLLQRGLQLRLAMARFGLIHLLAGIAFAVGAVGWLFVVPHLRAQGKTQKIALEQARTTLQLPKPAIAKASLSTTDAHLTGFYQTLGQSAQVEQQLKTVFTIADDAKLRVTLAEYKSAVNSAGHYRTYQLLLPLKGSYGDIRQFSEQVLLALPFASLDEITFKREAINNPMLEAKLRVTLYLADRSTPNVDVAAAPAAESTP